MGRLLAGTVPTWMCIGIATWCITRSLVADAPIGPIVVAAIASWLVGIVTLSVRPLTLAGRRNGSVVAS